MADVIEADFLEWRRLCMYWGMPAVLSAGYAIGMVDGQKWTADLLVKIEDHLKKTAEPLKGATNA